MLSFLWVFLYFLVMLPKTILHIAQTIHNYCTIILGLTYHLKVYHMPSKLHNYIYIFIAHTVYMWHKDSPKVSKMTLWFQGQWFRVQASDFKLDTEELPVQGVDDHIDLWVNGQGLNYLLHAHVKYVLLDQYL